MATGRPFHKSTIRLYKNYLHNAQVDLIKNSNTIRKGLETSIQPGVKVNMTLKTIEKRKSLKPSFQPRGAKDRNLTKRLSQISQIG